MGNITFSINFYESQVQGNKKLIVYVIMYGLKKVPGPPTAPQRIAPPP